jgi:hypothetical protein
MITPAYSLTATARILPSVAIDFTTASLDSRVTLTRSANTATTINSSGVIVGVNADLPRFTYNPTTLACSGLLIEDARTNLLLNSLIDGTSLSTQSVTTTAVSTTLSFYGTGTITLSGTSSATVTGTGAYPSRRTYTFTPTAGTLTLTVSGTVQFAQLEVGGTVTSFIPTAGAAVLRNADLATMTGTNFTGWFNTTNGSIYTETTGVPGAGSIYSIDDGTTGKRILGAYVTAIQSQFRVVDTTDQASMLQDNSIPSGGTCKLVGTYKANSFAMATNGVATSTDNTGTVPSGLTQMRLGRNVANATFLNGVFAKFMYWPQRITDNEVRAFSK